MYLQRTRIPRTAEPGGLPSMGSHRVGHDWGDLAVAAALGVKGFPSYSVVKNPPAMQETWIWLLGREDPLEESTATHSSILAWRIPWTEDPGGLQSMGSRIGGHNWGDWAHKHWELSPRREVQPSRSWPRHGSRLSPWWTRNKSGGWTQWSDGYQVHRKAGLPMCLGMGHGPWIEVLKRRGQGGARCTAGELSTGRPGCGSGAQKTYNP